MNNTASLQSSKSLPAQSGLMGPPPPRKVSSSSLSKSNPTNGAVGDTLLPAASSTKKIEQDLSMGVQLATKGVECDNAKDFDQALEMYSRSLEFLLPTLEHIKHYPNFETYKERVFNILKRAELLKGMVGK
jgi:hypothetical protein